MDYSIPFSELGMEHRDIAGGKGAMLGELTRLASKLPGDVQVPQGYVIPAEVFTEWLSAGGVTDAGVTAALHEVGKDIPKLTHIAKLLTERMRTVSVPEGVIIPPAGLYAVRSSAIGEDGSNMSFAGQHDSFLNIEPSSFKLALINVWLSTFNVRALYYRIVNGIEDRPLRQAVVVQQMLKPTFAGTAFSVDPRTGILDQGLIQYVSGLGDKLVSGRTTPTSHVFKHSELQELSGQMLLTTAEVCMELHRLLGYPVDIEWAWYHGLKLLQVRPITSLPEPVSAQLIDSIHPIYGEPLLLGEGFAPGEITARGFVRRVQAQAIAAGQLPSRKLDNRILIVPYTTPQNLPIL